jgi:hypothetical protein
MDVDERGEQSSNSKRSTPKTLNDISRYRQGDDPFPYFRIRKSYPASFPSGHASVVDDLRNSRNESVEALCAYVDAVNVSIAHKARLIRASARFKHDSIICDKFRPSSGKLSAPDGGGIGCFGSPRGNHVEQRRQRLDGVDVAALPAGFGKRRTSSSGGLLSKRSRTPVEDAPSLKPVSNASTPTTKLDQ